MPLKEYPTLTALMAGREPGSVKVRYPKWHPSSWIRPLREKGDGGWITVEQNGIVHSSADEGPWFLVSEDATALDTLRLEIAARVLAALHAAKESELPAVLHEDHGGSWDKRHAYALAEADALIAEARK